MPSVVIGQRIIGPNDESYAITDFLGRGAFGEVYRANGEITGTVIAVKLLPLGSLADNAQKTALLNEIRAAHQISHPNVVRVLHVDDGTLSSLGPFVCMEYVSGGALARLLRVQGQTNHQIPLTRAIEMMIDIAQGARAINERLVHRDIKPDNILIEGSTLKIGDFGISKFLNESTRLYTFKGGQHVAYMAPEGWTDEKNTHKLDVYAVGLVFYEILTLKHPLLPKVKNAGNISDWEKAHLYDTCPTLNTLRSDIPNSITQLVHRMVAKRPQDRPEWSEVLKILSDPAIDPIDDRYSAIAEAVASSIGKQQQLEEQNLKAAREQKDAERQHLLYKHSCETLIARFQPAIEQFNRQFQYGKIQVRQEHGIMFYRLPADNSIEVAFFAPKRTGIKVVGGVIIGGGWIGISNGRSANLVLLQDSADDLYGRWVICEIKLMALADPRKIIGRFGLTAQTVQPFGFKDAYFYEQIGYAQGGLHVFTYSFVENVEEYFAKLVAEACK